MSDIKRTTKPELLFEENAEKFNALVAQGKTPDLSNQNLSDLDLHAFNLKHANLSGSYLRGANLKGVDLSEANLDGASIKNALISGCLFPKTLSACEIQLSQSLGTRMRDRGN
ncbi:MAG: pentapeptide repeat-containing protein [Deltaproteobacteria bacterium]|jgi:uncharacterized protein YjbI with pentapeptide repeats|nr:pentapeptide repeat-containing protein [Deltaproteobacteria bacterium]